MQVNGDINYTGTLTLQGRDIKQFLDNHYELGLILIRGLIGGGYVGSSVWTNITLLSYATDAWATSAKTLTFATNYGGWASAHNYGYVWQGGGVAGNKVQLAVETTTAIGNTSYTLSSPTSVQHGVGYDTNGVAFGTKAYIVGNGSTSYSSLLFSTDAYTNISDGSVPTTSHGYGWYDRDNAWAFASASNYTRAMNFANETWMSLSTVNTPISLGMPQSQLEKGLTTKKGKAYVAGNNSWLDNRIHQYRNSINTWTINYGSQTQPNCEQAGTMGQNHGYLAGGYQCCGYNQNAHTDKVYHNTDSVVNIADAPRSLSSASPMWSPI